MKALNLPDVPAEPLASYDQLERLCTDFNGFNPNPMAAMRFQSSLEKALTYHGRTEPHLPMIIAMLIQQLQELRDYLTIEAIKKEENTHVHITH